MNSRKHLLAALALALVFAALTATSASALTGEQFAPGAHGSQPSQPTAPVPTKVTVEASSDDGFDWADAAIGAGATLAIALIGVGSALLLTNRPGRRERPATTA
jgi:hypothetical protein